MIDYSDNLRKRLERTGRRMASRMGRRSAVKEEAEG